MIRYAVNLAPFGEAADPRVIAQLAYEAEQSGWDGFFVWDHLNWDVWGPGMADPWICLSAAALTTSKVALGTMVTPVFRRRPAKLARETVSLQLLSEGRLILGVGLGSPDPQESMHLGEEGRLSVRARMTDEALNLLAQLWTGLPLDFDGEFYRIKSSGFLPTPPTPIPVWGAATWPFRSGPLKRAARHQGVIPSRYDDHDVSPEDLSRLVADIQALRPQPQPLDVVYGINSGEDSVRDQELVAQYQEAGLTWWMEPLDPWRAPFAQLRQRLQAGPPRG